MKKYTLPKHPFKGLKVYCKKCRINNSNCNHIDSKVYRIQLSVPGGLGSVRTKMLKSDNYEDAVEEAIQFKKEMEDNNFEIVEQKVDEGNDYSLVGAILKYNEFLEGKSQYAHLKKNISKQYRKEIIYYLTIFAQHIKQYKNIERIRPSDITKNDVSSFYTFLETRFQNKAFNKCMNALRGFFQFLIDEEEIIMKNPFRKFVPKEIIPAAIETLTEDEFNSILNALDTYTPYTILGGKGEKKTMYYPWLKDGFKLALLVGGRREEIVNLKWCDIFISPRGTLFFISENLKVMRIKKSENIRPKYIPINEDLKEFLIELGMNNQKSSNDYILFPERSCSSKTIMDRLSKSFTHYKNGAGITKNISLKNLRKTYITWVKHEMGDKTGLITSHSTGEVLDNYYVDPTILSAVDEAALKVKIFGKKLAQKVGAETKKDSQFNVSP